MNVSARAASITVTFHPRLNVLERQLRAVEAAAVRIVVDNGSAANERRALRTLLAEFEHVQLIENDHNRGLAAAINQGANAPAARDCEYLLFLDQDTEPESDALMALLTAHQRLERQQARPGIVGPRLIDARTGTQHGFHVLQGWRWRRVVPPLGTVAPVFCANLNCSGSLIRADLFSALGGMNEAFFMDHLDTDLSFRVLASGHTLCGIPEASVRHRMGEHTLRYWLFGWRLWPYRMPKRHYYLFRNAIWLMRRKSVPRPWKLFACIKLAFTLLVHFALDVRRREQLYQMLRGLRDGIR